MRDDEPVFKRSRWGTSRYVYNHRSPVGLALILITVVVVGIGMIMMATSSGPFAHDDATPSDPQPMGRLSTP